MNQPRTRLGASICQRRRMVVIAADNFGSFRHVSARRANRSQVHHNWILCNSFNDTLVGQVSHHEFATLVTKPMLDPIKIQINAKNAPLRARQNSIEKVTTNKTTATDNSHGDTRIIELEIHYFLTVNLPEFAPLFCIP